MGTREVKLDAETLDRITVAGLMDWRESISESEATAKHAEDRAADAMRIAAIDILLAYNGAEQGKK